MEVSSFLYDQKLVYLITTYKELRSTDQNEIRPSVHKVTDLRGARSKAWVCCRSLAEIVGSNPVRGLGVFLLYVLYVVR